MANWKEKLKNRTQRAVVNREAKNLARKSILDMSLIGLPLWTPKTGSGKENKNFIDIMLWRVSQDWYSRLRTKAGELVKLSPGDADYKLEIPRHGNVGAGKDHFVCLREAFGSADAICDEMFAEWQKRTDKNPDFDEKKARSMQPSWRDFYIIYDYDDPDKGYQLWEIAYSNFEAFLLEQMEKFAEGKMIPWDPEEGKSLEFSCREKKFGNNAYAELTGDIDFHTRDPYSDGEIDKVPSLDAAVIIPTQEDIHNAHYFLEEGQAPSADHQKAEPEQTASSGRTRTRGTSEPETQTRTRGKETSEKSKETVLDECPAGGKFGIDCNKLDACKEEACNQPVFEECLKRYNKMSEKASKDTSEKEQETAQASGRTRRR